MRTGTPTGTGVAAVTFAWSRNVPLVEPRSSTSQPPVVRPEPGVAARRVVVVEHEGVVRRAAEGDRALAELDDRALQRARRDGEGARLAALGLRRLGRLAGLGLLGDRGDRWRGGDGARRGRRTVRLRRGIRSRRMAAATTSTKIQSSAR